MVYMENASTGDTNFSSYIVNKAVSMLPNVIVQTFRESSSLADKPFRFKRKVKQRIQPPIFPALLHEQFKNFVLTFYMPFTS